MFQGAIGRVWCTSPFSGTPLALLWRTKHPIPTCVRKTHSAWGSVLMRSAWNQLEKPQQLTLTLIFSLRCVILLSSSNLVTIPTDGLSSSVFHILCLFWILSFDLVLFQTPLFFGNWPLLPPQYAQGHCYSGQLTLSLGGHLSASGKPQSASGVL